MKDLTTRSSWNRGWRSGSNMKGFGISSHFFESQMKKTIGTVLVKVAQGNRMVEVGGAPGSTILLYHQLRPDLKIDCIDYSPDGIEATHRVYDEEGISGEIVQADLRQYAEGKDRYDLVCSHGLVEHFEDYPEIIRLHVNLVKPGGMVFISVPDLSVFPVRILLNRFAHKMVSRHNFDCMDITKLTRCLVDAGAHEITSGKYGCALIPHSSVNESMAGNIFRYFAQAWNLTVALIARSTGDRVCLNLWDGHIFVAGHKPL